MKYSCVKQDYLSIAGSDGWTFLPTGERPVNISKMSPKDHTNEAAAFWHQSLEDLNPPRGI